MLKYLSDSEPTRDGDTKEQTPPLNKKIYENSIKRQYFKIESAHFELQRKNNRKPILVVNNVN